MLDMTNEPFLKNSTQYEKILDGISDIYDEPSKENANMDPSASTRMYQIGSLSAKNYNLEQVINQRYSYAHKNGDIHIHDLDYYFTINCMTHDLGKVLKGFDNGVGHIREPKRLQSAMALTAIILQSMQNNMFGGQAIDYYDKALAPYAKKEFDRQLKDVKSINPNLSEQEAYDIAMKRTEAECFQASEALIYNLNTMKSRSGNQVPFTSFNFGTDTTEWGRMITRNILLAYKAGLGNGENPLFPNLCFRIKDGINHHKEDPNYDMFQLAMDVASIRMNPTFAFMDSSFNKEFGDNAGYMGCRTRVMGNVNGPAVLAGRGNLFFTTINLPRLAIKSKQNINEFFNKLNSMMELVEGQLIERYNFVKEFKVKDIPFAMQYYMNAEGLNPEDSIEPAIKNGTLSIGFIGLAEALISLTGHHHGENALCQELGLKIIKTMRDYCDNITKKYHLNFTLLATPAEGLSGRFTAMDKKQYGIIPNVTDKDFYTNSFHVPVYYNCNIEHKVQIEGPYHKYTNAGHISYIELDSAPKGNTKAIEAILNCMYDNDMGYVGINFPKDFCTDCHYDGVIDDPVCPRCGGSHIKRTRRITGYMSDLTRFNPGKLDELKHRVAHGGRKFFK